MEYFKRGLENSMSCQISTLEALSGKTTAPDDLPPELGHLLRTTLVVSLQSPPGRRRIASQRIIDLLSMNRFQGELENALKKNGLLEVWSAALEDNVVLVADPQVTYYTQVSGVPLHLEKSTLRYLGSGIKRAIFPESANELQDRVDKSVRTVIIRRFGLTSEKARAELAELENRLSSDKAGFLRNTCPLWWESVTPEIRVLIFQRIFEDGHPVLRALKTLLNRKANTSFLRMQFAGCGLEIRSELVATAAIALQRRALPKNLLFSRTASRMEGFWFAFLETLIDYGSGAELNQRLAISNSKIPRWLSRIEGIREKSKLVESLCSLIVRLVVLNIHASVVVTSRYATPKVAVYGASGPNRHGRQRCLEELIRDNLEPCTGGLIGKMQPFPKSNPLKFRPVLKQFPEAISFSKTARIYLQAIKAREYSHLRSPVCRLNTALSIQRLGALASKGSLYIVKADVKDCYGSVDHTGLKEVVDQRWPTGEEALQFREVDVPLRPRLKARTVNLLQEHVFAWPLLEGRATILVPTERTIKLKGSEEKARLLFTIDNFIVSINDQCYRHSFVRGVPQGASPSPYLADLYLTYSVDVLFERLNDSNPNSAGDELGVFRTMDDYLVFTNRLDLARRAYVIFANEMHHPGVSFSKDKLMLNWLLDEQDPTGNSSALESGVIPLTIAYCGVEIDCATGSVGPLGEYKGFLRHSRRYFKQLHFQPPARALRYLLTTRYWAYSLGVFYLNKHNLPTLFRNMFQIAVESAVRFRSYADDSSLSNENLLNFVKFHRAAFYQYTRIQIFKASLGVSTTTEWSPQVANYLHTVAFKRAFELHKHRTRYETVIAYLDQELRGHQAVPHKDLLRRAIRPL